MKIRKLPPQLKKPFNTTSNANTNYFQIGAVRIQTAID